MEPAELERLVREDAVTGLTLNPTIFRAAVLGEERYAQRIAALRDRPPATLYEALAIEDVQAAADVLAPDGYVSLEVAPALARRRRRHGRRGARPMGAPWTGRTR